MRPYPDSLARYLDWLGRATPLHRRDLALRMEAMASDRFAFLRGSAFRWAETFGEICPKLAGAKTVLAVGDLHLENFGAWRDADSRLVWGINDFDDAYPICFTSDLVRLATSIFLAGSRHRTERGLEAIAAHLLDGYRDALDLGGRPYVLSGEHQWLRKAALSKLKDPARFWRKLDGFGPPSAVERREFAPEAVAALPEPHGRVRLVHRVAGMGSLGRSRVVAISEFQGGPTAREAKALAPSAWAWAAGRAPNSKSHAAETLRGAVRSADPTLAVTRNAIVRRLAPDGSRVELEDLPEQGDDFRLITAMGFETANVHLGSAAPAGLKRGLRALRRGWLVDAVERMRDQFRRDRRAFAG